MVVRVRRGGAARDAARTREEGTLVVGLGCVVVAVVVVVDVFLDLARPQLVTLFALLVNLEVVFVYASLAFGVVVVVVVGIVEIVEVVFAVVACVVVDGVVEYGRAGASDVVAVEFGAVAVTGVVVAVEFGAAAIDVVVACVVAGVFDDVVVAVGVGVVGAVEDDAVSDGAGVVACGGAFGVGG